MFTIVCKKNEVSLILDYYKFSNVVGMLALPKSLPMFCVCYDGLQFYFIIHKF
jgi:hypothetical protein